MFPISDSIPARRFAFLNWIIILGTVFVFIQQLITPDPEGFISMYALVPSRVNLADFTTFLPFITSIFLHGGFMHIISNMWFLKVFGDNVEGHINPLLFLFLYFGAGIIGGIAQYLTSPTSSLPMLGASGAVAGILGYYLAAFPQAKIRTFVIFFGFFTITTISATFMLGYWFVLQLFSGLGSIHASADQGGVAFFAHIGGFVFGYIFAKIFGRNNSQAIEGEVVN